MHQDNYRIDGHKLHFHVQRVADWLNNNNPYPIYMEVSPAGACNHRCTFCGLDFMQYRARFLPTDILKERLIELGRLGVKSIMYAGEGEPFLHRQMADLAIQTRQQGIDPAFTTNGVLMRPEVLEKILPITEWIKVSCNAGTAATYARIHRTREEDFNTVFDNLHSAIQLQQQGNSSCTLGLQMLLLPENRKEAIPLAQRCRDLGLNYLVIKPYSHHPLGKSTTYQSITYENDRDLAEELSQFNTDSFQTIVRLQTMESWNRKDRSYNRCRALPFWSYIDAGGNVWGCSVYLGDKRFYYGNIVNQSFQEIWEGKDRARSLQMMKDFDPFQCRTNCRMDKINTYLHQLKHPPAHVNFI